MLHLTGAATVGLSLKEVRRKANSETSRGLHWNASQNFSFVLPALSSGNIILMNLITCKGTGQSFVNRTGQGHMEPNSCAQLQERHLYPKQAPLLGYYHNDTWQNYLQIVFSLHSNAEKCINCIFMDGETDIHIRYLVCTADQLQSQNLNSDLQTPSSKPSDDPQCCLLQ